MSFSNYKWIFTRSSSKSCRRMPWFSQTVMSRTVRILLVKVIRFSWQILIQLIIFLLVNLFTIVCIPGKSVSRLFMTFLLNGLTELFLFIFELFQDIGTLRCCPVIFLYFLKKYRIQLFPFLIHLWYLIKGKN